MSVSKKRIFRAHFRAVLIAHGQVNADWLTNPADNRTRLLVSTELGDIADRAETTKAVIVDALLGTPPARDVFDRICDVVNAADDNRNYMLYAAQYEINAKDTASPQTPQEYLARLNDYLKTAAQQPNNPAPFSATAHDISSLLNIGARATPSGLDNLDAVFSTLLAENGKTPPSSNTSYNFIRPKKPVLPPADSCLEFLQAIVICAKARITSEHSTKAIERAGEKLSDLLGIRFIEQASNQLATAVDENNRRGITPLHKRIHRFVTDANTCGYFSDIALKKINEHASITLAAFDFAVAGSDVKTARQLLSDVTRAAGLHPSIIIDNMTDINANSPRPAIETKVTDILTKRPTDSLPNNADFNAELLHATCQLLYQYAERSEGHKKAIMMVAKFKDIAFKKMRDELGPNKGIDNQIMFAEKFAKFCEEDPIHPSEAPARGKKAGAARG